MSWDISIFKFSHKCFSIGETDVQILPLGTREEVQTSISNVFAGTDWSDPTWGIYEVPFGTVEFNVGKSEPVEGMMLHVRASEEIVAPIVHLCVQQGWQALDVGTGDFLEQATVPEAGLQDWSDYRDRVIVDEGDQTIQCFQHPDRGSVTKCSVCGKNLCQDCCQMASGVIVCSDTCQLEIAAHEKKINFKISGSICIIIGVVLGLVSIFYLTRLHFLSLMVFLLAMCAGMLIAGIIYLKNS